MAGLAFAQSQAYDAPASFERYAVIHAAQEKVVKIFGAGGLRQMEAYQTGILFSADGYVLTAFSYVLDTDDLAIVLNDGRRFAGTIVGSDPIRELAVVKVDLEGEATAYFDLSASGAPVAEPGDRVFALSNLYGIATGDEPVSVLQGVISAIAPLEARRGVFQSNYRGAVYIVDAHANNPGAAGGALIDWRGNLLGILGKELKSRVTGSWLHYAIPVEQFADVASDMAAGRSLQLATDGLAAPDDPLTLADLGLVLAPNVLPRTPPFVDGVLPDSAAAAAGIRPDDLIVFVAGQPTASCTLVMQSLARHEQYEQVRISVLRDGRLIEATLSAEGAPSQQQRDAERRDSAP